MDDKFRNSEWYFCVVVGLFLSLFPWTANADDLADSLALWEKNKLLCDAGQGILFPSKQTNDKAQPCDDGDMTLFNGLLCYAGDQRGCDGVAAAQDPTTGQWYRSPRIRLHGNDRGGADFSPDMAMGVQLYLLKTRDVARGYKWLTWLHDHVACSIEVLDRCFLRALPRFCTDDTRDAGCTMRHGDAALLSATVSYLQANAGMPPLPDGRLRGYLGTFSGYAPGIVAIDSAVNKPGYSQHLVAVSILALKAMGANDTLLDDATRRLVEKNSRNAFMLYLLEGKSARVRQVTLDKCPKAETVLRQPLTQWQWERDESAKAWEQSCYWDCIFMAELLH